MRKLIVAVSALALAVPAAPAAALAPAKQQTQAWRGTDGRLYCKRADGTIGLVSVGATGLLPGRGIDRSGNRSSGSILGGALGALLGRQVARNMMNRCR